LERKPAEIPIKPKVKNALQALRFLENQNNQGAAVENIPAETFKIKMVL